MSKGERNGGGGRTVEPIVVKKWAEGFDPGPETVDDKELYQAFGMLVEAKGLEETAKELRTKAYEVLGTAYTVRGLSGLYLPEVGTVSVYHSSQTRLNAGRFAELLVAQYGVPADHVAKAKQDATTTTENKKLTVKFEPVKGGTE
jgi:hypothetical protein